MIAIIISIVIISIIFITIITLQRAVRRAVFASRAPVSECRERGGLQHYTLLYSTLLYSTLLYYTLIHSPRLRPLPTRPICGLRFRDVNSILFYFVVSIISIISLCIISFSITIPRFLRIARRVSFECI